MKTLLKNAKVINVFSSQIEDKNVLIENDIIIGVGEYYTEQDADFTIDLSGKIISPSFIDGHIHIESTMLTPYELAKSVLPHGTTAIVCDPHEIANVCGVDGIKYILQSSNGLPLDTFVMIPSCVPATSLDESGAELKAKDILPLYKESRVLGLAEMMNYVGVVNGDKQVLQKLIDAKKLGKIINGHAPLLSGKDLDKYILSGVMDDHECSKLEEAKEKINKGQRVMIRQGTAAKNLKDLIGLFEYPWCDRCLLVSDDKHPADLLNNGHIDEVIRLAISLGANPLNAIKMATKGACDAFDIKDRGAIAVGYKADLVVLDNLENIGVEMVFKNGETVAKNGVVAPFDKPKVSGKIHKKVTNTFNLKRLEKSDFIIEPKGKTCRVIQVIKGQLITNEKIEELDFSKNNGIDIGRDIIKVAVVERHKNTGHKGVGFITGLSINSGAIASSVSHDSHNLIIVGASEEDMALAGNEIINMGGGCVVVKNGKVISKMPLPIAGLMTELSAKEIAEQNEHLRKSVTQLGVASGIEPFMTTAFVSLPVIPFLKMTTFGLVEVTTQTKKDLFV
ncbi:MAG: adenine deaminase [Clostridia bacterium]|nr:adenine deaminase [Clostridia bacterium]